VERAGPLEEAKEHLEAVAVALGQQAARQVQALAAALLVGDLCGRDPQSIQLMRHERVRQLAKVPLQEGRALNHGLVHKVDVVAAVAVNFFDQLGLLLDIAVFAKDALDREVHLLHGRDDVVHNGGNAERARADALGRVGAVALQNHLQRHAKHALFLNRDALVVLTESLAQVLPKGGLLLLLYKTEQLLLRELGLDHGVHRQDGQLADGKVLEA
jgi:hypothetical protein